MTQPPGLEVKKCVRLTLALALSCEDKPLKAQELASMTARILAGLEKPPPEASALLEADPPACLGSRLTDVLREAAKTTNERLSHCMDRVKVLESMLAEARAEIERLLKENERLRRMLAEPPREGA